MTQSMRYQIISRLEIRGKVSEWTTGTRYFRVKDRAVKEVQKSKKIFGNAELITWKICNGEHVLISVEKV